MTVFELSPTFQKPVKKAAVLFTGMGQPNGGDIHGLIDHYGRMIGMIGPNTKIIPGHAPLNEWWNRGHLIAYRDMMAVTRDRLVKLILEEGKTLEQVIAARPTADYDATFIKPDVVAAAYDEGMYPRFTNAEEYIRTVYNQLKGTNLPSPLAPVGDPRRLSQANPAVR